MEIKRILLIALLFCCAIGSSSGQAINITNDQYHLYGPNSTWSQYLQVGGNGQVTDHAFVAVTNGNLHLDAKAGFSTYINYYSKGNTYLSPQGGRVGIGTTDPATAFEVRQATSGWTMNSRVTAASPGEINGLKFYSGYLGEDKWAGISSVTEDLHSNRTGFSIYTNQSEKLRISAEGNVGISTSAPRAVLDVAKYVGFGSLGIVLSRMGEGDENGDGTYLGVKGYETQFSTYNGKTFALEHSFYGQTNSSVSFYRGSSEIGGFMTFSTNNNKEQMRIDSWGNIGIGITNPTERLTVNGKIKANEIRVDGQGAPDYVFEDGYKIESLTEVENYIKVNRHLPEVPSAKEFDRDGIAVGEMNKLLLKKIEELTLHVIEQNKQLIEQNKKIDNQNLKIMKLEKKMDGKTIMHE